MTGKEILEEEFEKSGMRGYRADQVDAFLQRVAQYVDEQENEKSDLTYKIQILADKIEEYKKDEENIREALLGAQKLGSSILNEAKSKAETLTREAKSTSDEMLSQAKSKVDSLTKESLQKANQELSSIKRECDMERRRLEMMKQEVSGFRASLLKQYKQHLDLLSNLPSVEEKPEPRPAPSYISRSIPEEPVTAVPTQENPGVPEESVEAEPINEEISAAPVEEDFPADRPQTIKSDIVSLEDDIAEEEKEHTKEFGSEKPFPMKSAEKEDIAGEEPKPDFAPRHGSRQNYIEKFGELKFNLGDKEKQ